METSEVARSRQSAVMVGGALLALGLACGDDSAAGPGGRAASQPGDGGPGTNGDDPIGPSRDNGDAAAGGDGLFGFDDLGVDPVDDMGRPIVDPPPPDWVCDADFARDGICDCGCGTADPDCSGAGCGEPGCAVPACQVCFAADGSARDCAAPGTWGCMRALQGDGICDCGCGAPDPDCDDLGCYPVGCSVPACERCPLADDETCGAPSSYTCHSARIGDGLCDCGCGNLDPDCRQASCLEPGCTAPGCERCTDDEGDATDCAAPDSTCDPAVLDDGVCDCGCSVSDPDCGEGQGCSAPGCEDEACEVCHDAAGRTVPCPGSWTCPPERFADGSRCDCGCGRADPDCGDGGCGEAGCDAEACELRHDADGDAIRPDAWGCEASRYDSGDGCDCGCGAPDPDCVGGCSGAGCQADGCDRCRLESGELFECRFTCDSSRWNDGQCDCGCGTSDPDCGQLGCPEPGCFADGCELCEGSEGPLACERGSCPAGFKNDGVCDCGCREVDVDCLTSVACVEPGCGEAGCGRCHDDAGAVFTCPSWACGLEKQGGGDGCNCGCGAPDPDCEQDAGCSGPGCVAEGCITCRTADGAPMSCDGGQDG